MAHLLDGWKARNTRGSYPPFQRPTNREDFSMPVRQSESSPSAVEKLEKMAQELQSPSALQKRSRMEASEKDQPVPGGAEDRIRKMNRDLEEKWGLTDTSSSRPAETPQPSLTKTVSPKAFQAEARRYDDSSWAACLARQGINHMQFQSCAGRHLMLSGRFNTPERLEYIKDVKDELASRGIETFMVEEPAGGSFRAFSVARL
eukprot:g33161.t1